MRKAIFTALAMGLTTLGAAADVKIQEILPRRQGADINIRVTVVNPAATTQKGPVTLSLFVRQNGGEAWQRIKTWTNIAKMPAGNRVSRDFFEENNATLRALAEQGAFEIRATASAPGAPRSAELTSSWKDTNSGH
jgi:hypothetical protein